MDGSLVVGTRTALAEGPAAAEDAVDVACAADADGGAGGAADGGASSNTESESIVSLFPPDPSKSTGESLNYYKRTLHEVYSSSLGKTAKESTNSTKHILNISFTSWIFFVPLSEF